jgi:PKD repeat protein
MTSIKQLEDSSIAIFHKIFEIFCAEKYRLYVKTSKYPKAVNRRCTRHMNNHISRLAFNGKNSESTKGIKQKNKKMLTSLITLTLISLLVFTPQMVFVASASSEPSLSTILANSGFTNIELSNIETFPAGIYNITLLAEFAGYYNNNILSYYVVETTDYHTIFTGPEGASGSDKGGYVVPPLSKMFEVDNEFGLSMTTPQYQYFSEHSLNPDFPEQHCQVYKNLDDPKTLLIGFENNYGGSISRDYNDMVFSLTLITNVDVVSVNQVPQTPNYNEPVVVTSQVKTGSYEIDSVILSYRVDFGSWTNLTMNPDMNDYIGTIPAQQYGATVTYKVYVSDTFGSTGVSSDYSYVVGDFIAPVIIDVDQIPLAVDAGQLVKILANVTEPTSASGIKKVYLWYKANDGWLVNGMGLDDGLWVANLPGQKQGNPVQYYVEAFDNAGNSAETSTFSYIVIIPNNLPTADFSVSPSPAYVDETVNFDGSASSDSDGNVLNYFWDFGDETYAQGETATHVYDQSGEYTVSLKVTDNRGGTGTTTKTVTVENRPPPEEPNNKPVAAFTESPEPVYATETVTFDASESYDSDGAIVSYSWNFGDGTAATGKTVTHVYVDYGSYGVELTVTDNDGATDSTTAAKTILNNSPVASFTQASDEVIIGEEDSFNASESYDVDGTIVSYSWNFGDGTTATGVTAVHAYTNSGVCTVTLTVTDDNGATDSVTSTITVTNQAPIASFTANTTEIIQNQGIRFDASESYDVDGTIVSYSWNFGDGTTTTGVIADHVYSEERDYTVTLVVSDDDGATDSTTIDLTVDAEPEVSLAVLSVIGLGITALTATILYGLFVRRNKKKKSKRTY